MDITLRRNVEIGMLVEIFDKDKANLIEKDKFKSEEEIKYTRGYVVEVVSKSNSEDGIKVRLDNGKVGRIRKFISIDTIKRENFVYWNIFFQEKIIYSIWDKKDRKFFSVEKTMGDSKKTIAFLFSKKENADKILAELKDSKYIIQKVNGGKSILDNFSKLSVDIYNVNLSKNVRAEKLLELERKFA